MYKILPKKSIGIKQIYTFKNNTRVDRVRIRVYSKVQPFLCFEDTSSTTTYILSGFYASLTNAQKSAILIYVTYRVSQARPLSTLDKATPTRGLPHANHVTQINQSLIFVALALHQKRPDFLGYAKITFCDKMRKVDTRTLDNYQKRKNIAGIFNNLGMFLYGKLKLAASFEAVERVIQSVSRGASNKSTINNLTRGIVTEEVAGSERPRPRGLATDDAIMLSKVRAISIDPFNGIKSIDEINKCSQN
ncbi:hypothetical protein WN51_12464 [Melipona quadrifasciata]|uniref:Uncharacterized protein n=1 Tax=Melipona quadrifasciata TaxID=166423 RepID=A0A0N0BHM8_9HYME|nr:hypothetical protein WN51_12464 [Melipona quadrifasciata]